MAVFRRLVEIAGLLSVLSVALFFLLHLAPGSSEDALLAQSANVTTQDLERLQKLRGLDRPILERYGCWLFGQGDRSADDRCAYWPSRGLLAGDLGYSRVHKIPVDEIITNRLAATLTLTVPAFFLAALLAMVLGVASAVRSGRAIDRLVRGASVLGLSLPPHWLAMIAIVIIALFFGIFPSSGKNDAHDPSLASHLHHAALPVLTLTLLYAARWIRYTRAAAIEALEQDYVRSARAFGLPERQVLARHVARNVLLPLVTVLAQSLPGLFAGALVIETVFAYPGMGVLIVESVEGDDHLVAMIIFLFLAAITMSATLLADLLYAALDPRVRAGARTPFSPGAARS